ncbi:LysR family transcriptional regulator [Paraburkholderia megapolitana]|uniref:LysR family transcriptional regulator n=1 Tax=Paraburkholderia megapolitana TaxID=420953 RepID=UPI0038B77CFF
MNIRHLEYFVILSDELHFRRTAERLGITQAPLSLGIQALENELGARLFHRTKRAVSLTEAGMALLDDARAVLSRLEHGKEAVWQTVSGEVGRLRVGFTNASSLAPFFPHLIRQYRTSWPKVSMVLSEISSSLQLEALEQRELDVSILRLLPNAQVNSMIVCTPLLQEPLLLALHSGHPLAKAEQVSVADVRDEAFIVYARKAGIAVSEQILQLCAKRGFVPNVVQEVQQASTMIGLASTGLGVAIVPAPLATIAVPGVVFRTFTDLDATTTLYVAHRFGDANSRVRQFVNLALDIVQA